MTSQSYGAQMLAQSTARTFLRAVTELAAVHPHPNGPAIRVTLTAIYDDEDLGSVDVDVTNLWDLGNFATRRAAAPIAAPSAPTGVRRLRVVGGA